MTFAPPTLVALGRYLVLQGCVNLGVVGDAPHQAGGVSYHLGRDKLRPWDPVRRQPYSIASVRDGNGVAKSNAASAIDIGEVDGSLGGLQALSVWLSGQCVARAIDTLDIREVIYSPDGTRVERWDAETQQVYPGGTGTGQGDNSHRTHTHVSYYRDSEFRGKLSVFERYWEDALNLSVVKGEDWTPTTTRRPYRSQPVRSGPVVGYIEVGQTVRTIAEAQTQDGNNWRLTEIAGKPAWLLRSDFTPALVAVDQGLTDYINRVPVSVADCGPAIEAARAPLVERIARIKAKVAANAADVAND